MTGLLLGRSDTQRAAAACEGVFVCGCRRQVGWLGACFQPCAQYYDALTPTASGDGDGVKGGAIGDAEVGSCQTALADVDRRQSKPRKDRWRGQCGGQQLWTGAGSRALKTRLSAWRRGFTFSTSGR